jgi:Domain of unknown function (DUF4150)
MGSPVFANAMEISSKSMGGKSICEFPDVCFTPPLTPATPPGVPIPYPNTGMAGDTSDGSTSVKIGGEQIMLKDKSAFKQSTGDEAGCAPKKGVISSKIKGKVYFIAWSMDVKVEGENVVRNLDMTTHNHGSPANGAVPMVHVATMSPAFEKTNSCAGDKEKIKEKCGTADKQPCPGVLSRPKKGDGGIWSEVQKSPGAQGADVSNWSKKISAIESPTTNAANIATAEANGNACVQAMRCVLRPYKPDDPNKGCCPGQTGHHVPPKSMLNKGNVAGYNEEAALCVCLEGMSQHVGSHGENHAAIDYVAAKEGAASGPVTLKKYNSVCAKAVAAQCNCNEKCIEDQLNNSFNDDQLNSKVTHWQSDSKQLSGATQGKIDKLYQAAPKAKVSAP